MTEAQYHRWASTVGKKIDYSRKVNAVAQACLSQERLLAVFQSPPSQNDEEFEQRIQRSTNPMELLADWAEETNRIETDSSLDGICFRHFSKTTEASFRRYGDVNWLDSSFRRAWISTQALELDVECMELSKLAGFEIEPCDVIDFMMRYPKGKRTYEPAERLERIEDAFKALTGFRPNWSFYRQLRSKLESQASDTVDAAPF